MYEQRKKSTHLVMAGALVASPFAGACDCTTFGVDPIEQTTGTTTLAETIATPTTETLPTTTADGATMSVLTGTFTVDATSTTDESDTSSTDTSMTADQTSSGSSGGAPPEAPVLHLEFSAIKQFDFSWSAVAGADFYRLLEQQNPEADYAQLGIDIVGETMSFTMPLHLRHTASYILQACNPDGCTDSDPVAVDDPLVAAIGYFKPNVIEEYDLFGTGVDLSNDGDTLVVGAYGEDSADVGIDADPTDNGAPGSGAVSVFVRAGSEWSHQIYIKASNTGANDGFGLQVALSSDGDTLAVSASDEDGSSIGVNGGDDNAASNSGAVYVFVRDGADWTQQAYIKASNTDPGDIFGASIALSGDGNTLVVGADGEGSEATGVNGSEGDNGAPSAGAVYVFTRTNVVWQQEAYLKASNTDAGDRFGSSVAVSADGMMIAVGAPREASNATGVAGNQLNDSAAASGAVYVFEYQNSLWKQQVYIKASNTAFGDEFGGWVALSAAADTLAVGASGEDSGATGINSDEDNDSALDSGAVYVFLRTGNAWQKQAYVKMSDTRADDMFGQRLDLSASGDQLVVSAVGEDSSSLGVSNGPFDDLGGGSGAANVFVRNGGEWAQHAQVKASNAGLGGGFGSSVSLSGDGETLAVTSVLERSKAVGIGGDQNDNSLLFAGACYLY